MKARALIALSTAGLLLAACGTTTTERAATGGLAGAALGAAVDGSVAGALIGGAAGATLGAVTTKRSDNVNRRQYYDERAGRYYYQDSNGRYYWEDGSRR